MPTPLEATITSAAQGPKKAQNDMGSIEQHDLSDLIEADKYLAGQTAAATKAGGLRFTKLVPPGAA